MYKRELSKKVIYIDSFIQYILQSIINILRRGCYKLVLQ